MSRIVIMLTPIEIETLRQSAEREFRPTRDHARLLLLTALGIVDGQSRNAKHWADTIIETEAAIYAEVAV